MTQEDCASNTASSKRQTRQAFQNAHEHGMQSLPGGTRTAAVLRDGKGVSWQGTMDIPVVHHSKLAIRRDKLQGALGIKSVEGHTLVEVAVVQHHSILRGAASKGKVIPVSTTSPANGKRVIEG